MVALVDLWLHQELLCTAKLNCANLTCGLQPPSLKNTVVNSRQLCGGKFRGHLQTPSKEVRPDKMSMGSCEKMFFARTPKSLHGFAKVQLQITKFGLPQRL